MATTGDWSLSMVLASQRLRDDMLVYTKACGLLPSPDSSTGAVKIEIAIADPHRSLGKGATQPFTCSSRQGNPSLSALWYGLHVLTLASLATCYVVTLVSPCDDLVIPSSTPRAFSPPPLQLLRPPRSFHPLRRLRLSLARSVVRKLVLRRW